MPKSGIFISYRHNDTAGTAGRIYEHLVRVFGKDNVFLDSTKIRGGEIWKKSIDGEIRHSAVVLAIIGPVWLTITEKDGTPRLQNPNDPLRHELEYAQKKRKLIIPVCINETPVPTEDQLPESLRWLPGRHAKRIYDSDFDNGISALIKTLKSYFGCSIDPKRLLLYGILCMIVILGIIFTIRTNVNKKSASQTATARFLVVPTVATNTLVIFTPSSPATSTPTVVQSPVPTTTQTASPTLTSTPKLECVNATVKSIKLFLDNGWKDYNFVNGTHIVLARNESSGLTGMIGRAVFTNPSVLQNCICSWQGGTTLPYEDLSTQSNDCSFYAPLTGKVEQLYLILKTGGNSQTFVIDFP